MLNTIGCFVILIIAAVDCSSKITFPQIDDFDSSCTMTDGSAGTCRNIKYCPTAMTARSAPKTCYFEQNDHFICCRNAEFENMKKSPAIKECENAYPLQQFIISGLQTKYQEFPYMAALGWDTNIDENVYDYKCGGVLVSSRFVLTAAHCAEMQGVKPSVILPGGVNLTDSTQKPNKIVNVIIHPKYESNTAYHDIALLELEESLESHKPVCVWPEYSLVDLSVTAIGYGHTRFAGASSDQLLKAYLNIITNNDCQQFYETDNLVPKGLMDNQLCAQDPQRIRDTCQGDSGGPIIMIVQQQRVNRPFVIGITSFGDGCARDAPGVYTRVSEYLPWIESIVWSK